MVFDDIKNAIHFLFNFNIIEESEDCVVYSLFEDKTAYLYRKDIEHILSDLGNVEMSQNIELYDSNSYEVFVTSDRHYREFQHTDSINRIDYAIKEPSDKYLVFFLYNLSLQDSPRILRSGTTMHRLKRSYNYPDYGQRSLFDEDGHRLNSPSNILEVIKKILRVSDTLQIKSESPKSKKEFEQLVYAYLFNLSYNLEHIFQPLRFAEEVTQFYRFNRVRKRAETSEVECPRRLYINELVLHYQRGIVSDSIDLKYLSFYHVLEYFFEKVYNDEIINSIKFELTKPDFSYKRNKDISHLVNIIQKKLKYKNEEYQINELEALKLTLRYYVTDIGYLIGELNSISEFYVNYYKTNEVPFSRGNKVNLENTDLDEVYDNLAKRIYYTRNSIVHSKETDKNKYTPFRDDRVLLFESHLIRILAEIVIIETSKEL